MKTVLIHTIQNEVIWGVDGINLSPSDSPLRINLNSDLTNNASGFVQNRQSNQLMYNVDGTSRPVKIVSNDEIGTSPSSSLQLSSLHINVTEQLYGIIPDTGTNGINIDTYSDKITLFYPAKLDERIVYVDGGIVLEKNGTNTNSGANQEYHQIILDLGGTLDSASTFLGHSFKFKNGRVDWHKNHPTTPPSFLFRNKNTKVIEEVNALGKINGIGFSNQRKRGDLFPATVASIINNFTINSGSNDYIEFSIKNTNILAGDIISLEINFNGVALVRRNDGASEILGIAEDPILQNPAYSNIEFVPFFYIHSDPNSSGSEEINSFDDWSLIGYDF